MNQLQIQLEQIGPLHQPSMDMAVRRWNSIAKPLNSLGLLEKNYHTNCRHHGKSSH